MKNKKILLVFVEGDSDDVIISSLIEDFCEKLQLRVKVMNGDVFTRRNSNGKIIAGESIKMAMENYGFSPKDVSYVAFITDTDGIFIPESDFVVTEGIETSYSYDLVAQKVKVESERRLGEIQRSWSNKMKNLMPLMTEGLTLNTKNGKIAYGVYYNALDLEHVTQGKILVDHEKTRAADDLMDEVDAGNVDLENLFRQKLIESGYTKSWKALENEPWSNAYSNIAILLDKIIEINDNLK